MRHLSLFIRTLFGAMLVLLAACGPEAPPTGSSPAATRLAAVGVEPTGERPRPSGVTPIAAPTAIPEESSVTTAAVDPRELGDPAAPITVIEYSDFQ